MAETQDAGPSQQSASDSSITNALSHLLQQVEAFREENRLYWQEMQEFVNNLYPNSRDTVVPQPKTPVHQQEMENLHETMDVPRESTSLHFCDVSDDETATTASETSPSDGIIPIPGYQQPEDLFVFSPETGPSNDHKQTNGYDQQQPVQELSLVVANTIPGKLFSEIETSLLYPDAVINQHAVKWCGEIPEVARELHRKKCWYSLNDRWRPSKFITSKSTAKTLKHINNKLRLKRHRTTRIRRKRRAGSNDNEIYTNNRQPEFRAFCNRGGEWLAAFRHAARLWCVFGDCSGFVFLHLLLHICI